VRASGQVAEADFPLIVGRISFFVNAGIRFVEELCKMRAFTQLWDRICAERYGVTDPKLRRFRYGLQVNSLGLTEAQPENNVARIVLEMLGVTLSKDARARAVQLPAWNEALGLPTPWDQQWSLRLQQVLAFETDLLEHDDLFTGSTVVEAKTTELAETAWAELTDIIDRGGAFAAIGELKARLVRSHTERLRRIESGELKVVGVNCFTESEPSPLAVGELIVKVDPTLEAAAIADLTQWRAARDAGAVTRALDELRAAATNGTNIMESSIQLAQVGGTVGEWSTVLREVFGEFRAPTGVGAGSGGTSLGLDEVAKRSQRLPGGPPRLLVAKPGLDGHSNGAEQIAVAARDAGMEVIYQGIRSTPEQIVSAAADEDPDVIGLSILSGSHLLLVPDLLARLRSIGIDAPVVLGGIIPEADAERLIAQGVSRVYTPKDFDFTKIMNDIVDVVEQHRARY
jgi:ethylmalonyl-CoA mutase